MSCFIVYLTAGECTDGEMRLKDGTTSNEGRVELCLGGVWGVIADRTWGTDEAKVTCRQLGFTDACEYECGQLKNITC